MNIPPLSYELTNTLSDLAPFHHYEIYDRKKHGNNNWGLGNFYADYGKGLRMYKWIPDYVCINNVRYSVVLEVLLSQEKKRTCLLLRLHLS